VYPIKFKPIYKNVIWGGQRLAEIFARNIPSERIGESWEISQNEYGVSIVSNGPLQGMSIETLLMKNEKAILGNKKLIDGKFPLLIKYIDAHDNLSIQVHPDDQYAYAVEGGAGKTEAWYIVAAKEDARIIYGLKENMSRQMIAEYICTGHIDNILHVIPVKTGDLYFIPPGTVHAILEGIVVCEVQQNSNLTYRLYDYNRTDKDGNVRELHIDQALDVICCEKADDLPMHRTITCKYFFIRHCEVQNEELIRLDNQFCILCVLKGEGHIHYNDTQESVRAGETILLPACLEKVMLVGSLSCLKIR